MGQKEFQQAHCTTTINYNCANYNYKNKRNPILYYWYHTFRKYVYHFTVSLKVDIDGRPFKKLPEHVDVLATLEVYARPGTNGMPIKHGNLKFKKPIVLDLDLQKMPKFGNTAFKECTPISQEVPELHLSLETKERHFVYYYVTLWRCNDLLLINYI